MGEPSGRVGEAMRAVPRTGFLPRSLRRRASYDGPLPIGHGQTNSQPRTVADMLVLLEVRPGQHCLTISGTEQRRRLAQGEDLPAWFTPPEVAAELRRAFPPRRRAMSLTGAERGAPASDG